jgi:hypothetical protein
MNVKKVAVLVMALLVLPCAVASADYLDMTLYGVDMDFGGGFTGANYSGTVTLEQNYLGYGPGSGPAVVNSDPVGGVPFQATLFTASIDFSNGVATGGSITAVDANFPGNTYSASIAGGSLGEDSDGKGFYFSGTTMDGAFSDTAVPYVGVNVGGFAAHNGALAGSVFEYHWITGREATTVVLGITDEAYQGGSAPLPSALMAGMLGLALCGSIRSFRRS